MYQLEGLQYETTSDLNIGYYNISILPASQDMTTIVAESGKFKYNNLSMGMCASWYVLQYKVYHLLSDI